MDLLNYINKIRDNDDKIHLIIEASFADLTKEVLKSAYPMTGRALIGLAAKTNFIKNGIFDLCETSDSYSANILYRSLIEHYLRHQYIFINFARGKNDDIGKDYYEACDMGENLDFLRAIKSTNLIFDPDNADIDAWQEIRKLDSRFEKYTPKELKAKYDKFRYKNIIEFISSTISVKDGILKQIIPLYAELSSFVHGGPYGERVLLSHSAEETRMKALKDICEMTFVISKGIKSFTYLFACQINKKYGPFYNQINSISLDTSG